MGSYPLRTVIGVMCASWGVTPKELVRVHHALLVLYALFFVHLHFHFVRAPAFNVVCFITCAIYDWSTDVVVGLLRLAL